MSNTGEVYDEEAQRAVEAICKERDELKARVDELERRNAATLQFTREEIEMIRLLLRGIDKQVGRYSLSHTVVTKLINKCDAILKGAAG